MLSRPIAEHSDDFKREKADVETLIEFRQHAIDALRKMVGKIVTLKKGAGTVKDDPRPGVTINIGGPEMVIKPEQIEAEDIDTYAPKQANAAEDARRRGLLFLAGGNVPKAKDYFTKARDTGLGDGATTYLDRIKALELEEAEALALRSWQRAEKLFAAKSMKAANDAYQAFEREHAKSQALTQHVATLNERYAAIEVVLGPPATCTLDLGGGVKLEMVLIPSGKFMMGSPDNEAGRDKSEGPQHEVTITKPFYMGKYEVTVAQFRRFAEATMFQTTAEKEGKGSDLTIGAWRAGLNWKTHILPQDDNHPVCMISWDDAEAFASWASKATGKIVGLPTEAEWECACRARTTTRFNLGDKDKDLDMAGWFNFNSEKKTHPVGQKAPNAWGLYDMHGNVMEWCEDRFAKDYYKDSPRIDPKGAFEGNHVLRGGSWHEGPSPCRAAVRRVMPGDWPSDVRTGFRVVMAVPPRKVTITSPEKPTASPQPVSVCPATIIPPVGDN